ncbi:hypothetical protein EDB30_101596 [Vibrio crassostreae]|nr:hypothetical protein EDB30_101596 [Vibrio crassostreae]
MGSYWGSKKEPSKLKLKLIDQYHNKNPEIGQPKSFVKLLTPTKK